MTHYKQADYWVGNICILVFLVFYNKPRTENVFKSKIQLDLPLLDLKIKFYLFGIAARPTEKNRNCAGFLIVSAEFVPGFNYFKSRS
jgi:hypothetical protein